MPLRKLKFITGEYYHVYNRGTDKRAIILNKMDLKRLIETILAFNNVAPKGCLRHAKRSISKNASHPLVEFIAFAIQKNHFHFLIKQVSDNGIEKFMQRFGTGYTKYFNKRYDRTGVLFQGPFKAKHVDSNNYLLYLSAYINFNETIHETKNTLSTSSREEYEKGITSSLPCSTDIILKQFKSRKEYVHHARLISKQIAQSRKHEKLRNQKRSKSRFDLFTP